MNIIRLQLKAAFLSGTYLISLPLLTNKRYQFIAHCNALQGPCVYPIRLQHRWQRHDLDRAKKTEECMRFREMTTLLSVGIP